jgi:hypothetical protein
MAFVFKEMDNVIFFSRNSMTKNISKIQVFVPRGENQLLQKCIKHYMFGEKPAINDTNLYFDECK